jgi:LysR family glycine cleavage system transcriptional activator
LSYRLPPLAALRAFESAARHLSFKKAAEELNVTPAAVSQQIKALETYLGLSLFRRLTRALEMTAQGQAMLPKIREGFECLAAAIETAAQTCEGVLNINAPPSFASRWLLPRLPGFAVAHPEIEVRLSSSADTVDRRGETSVSEDEFLDPRSAVNKVVIRYGKGHYPGYRVEQILAPERVPVCSPQLPTPQRPLAMPADLHRHVLIHDETIDAEEHLSGWAQWLSSAGAVGIDAQRGPRFSNAVLAVEAALNGQGVALALRPLVAADIAAGRLIVPIDFAVPSPYAYYLVLPEAMTRRSSVAAFRSWLIDEAAREDRKASA